MSWQERADYAGGLSKHRFLSYVPETSQGPIEMRSDPYSLSSALERLLPDELFGEVMQGMVDSAWLRERAETVAASGDPFSNEKAAALFEAADAAAALGSPEAAP